MITPQHGIGSGFGFESTAREVLAGVDLSGRLAVVTGGRVVSIELDTGAVHALGQVEIEDVPGMATAVAVPGGVLVVSPGQLVRLADGVVDGEARVDGVPVVSHDGTTVWVDSSRPGGHGATEESRTPSDYQRGLHADTP